MGKAAARLAGASFDVGRARVLVALGGSFGDCLRLPIAGDSGQLRSTRLDQPSGDRLRYRLLPRSLRSAHIATHSAGLEREQLEPRRRTTTTLSPCFRPSVLEAGIVQLLPQTLGPCQSIGMNSVLPCLAGTGTANAAALRPAHDALAHVPPCWPSASLGICSHRTASRRSRLAVSRCTASGGVWIVVETAVACLADPAESFATTFLCCDATLTCRATGTSIPIRFASPATWGVVGWIGSTG